MSQIPPVGKSHHGGNPANQQSSVGAYAWASMDRIAALGCLTSPHPTVLPSFTFPETSPHPSTVWMEVHGALGACLVDNPTLLDGHKGRKKETCFLSFLTVAAPRIPYLLHYYLGIPVFTDIANLNLKKTSATHSEDRCRGGTALFELV